MFIKLSLIELNNIAVKIVSLKYTNSFETKRDVKVKMYLKCMKNILVKFFEIKPSEALILMYITVIKLEIL